MMNYEREIQRVNPQQATIILALMHFGWRDVENLNSLANRIRTVINYNSSFLVQSSPYNNRESLEWDGHKLIFEILYFNSINQTKYCYTTETIHSYNNDLQVYRFGTNRKPLEKRFENLCELILLEKKQTSF